MWACTGLLLLIGSVPLIVVLPEAGVPALLLALRFLAVEFDWAAQAYAWVMWRWGQLRAWYHARAPVVRGLVVLGLVTLAALLLFLLVSEFV